MARPSCLAVVAMVGLAAPHFGLGTAAAQPAEIVGDEVPKSLTGAAGNAARGREIVLGQTRGNCAICHAVPAPDEKYHGDLAPRLHGVGSRLNRGQIRLRMVDSRRINPRSIMPAYYRIEGLKRVAAAFSGKTVFTAAEIEDVVAYLATLTD